MSCFSGFQGPKRVVSGSAPLVAPGSKRHPLAHLSYTFLVEVADPADRKLLDTLQVYDTSALPEDPITAAEPVAPPANRKGKTSDGNPQSSP